MKRTIPAAILTLFFLFFVRPSQAQLSGIYTVPGSFTSVAVAIRSLNLYGVAGPVTVNIAAGYTETCISGGYSLYPVVGSSSLNTVTFRKNGAGNNPIIYAYAGGFTSSSFTQDVVWRIIGADYVTIDRINITDNNGSNPNTMEAGIAFFKASPNNGCQHNTISNCVISLKKTNNAAGSGSAVGGSRGIDMVNTYPASHHFNIPVTSVNGSHSHNKFYGNVIQDCNFGISLNSVVSGTIPGIFHDSYNDIGGVSAVTGNTIINFGGGGTLTAAGGIYTKGQREINISYNQVNSNNGSGLYQRAANLYGIFVDQEAGTNVAILSNTVTVRSGSACPAMYAIWNNAGSTGTGNTVTITGNLICNVTFTNTNIDYYGIRNTASADHVVMSQNTFSNNVNNQSLNGVNYMISNDAAVKSMLDMSGNAVTHSVSVFGGYSGSLRAISSLNTPTSVAMTVSNNTFPNFYIAGSSSPNYIYLAGDNASLTISNNTVNNLVNYNTAATSIISNESSTSYSLCVMNNAVTNFSVPIQAISFAGIAIAGDSPSTCTMTIANNTVANIQYTTTGNTAYLTGIYVYGGEGPTYPLKYVYNNLVRDMDNNTYGGTTGMLVGLLGEGGAGGTSSVHHNTVTNLSANGDIFGIRTWSLVAPNNYCEIHSNVIHSVVCTSTNQAIGVQFDNGKGKVKFYKNRITNVTTLGSVLQAWGIEAVEGDSIYIYNNIIGHITAGFSGSQDASQGIFIVDYGFYGVYYNTIYLMGGAYGSSCVHAYTTPTVDLRNNIMVNLSSPAGNGITAAYRRVSQTMTGYSPLTNNNLYYAGTPANNRALVRWSAQTWSTTAQLKTYLSGREYNTVTENVPFASVTSTASNYLHISTSTTTQVEGGAQPISWITDDFYGNPRNANYPDIGAIEGSYLPATGDVFQPTIRSSGFSNHSCGQSGRTFTAQLSDRSGVATGTNSPRLYYRVNSGAWNSAGSSLSAGSTTLGTWTFSMSYAVSYGDVISWYMVAQDIATTPNLVSLPPQSYPGSNVNTITLTPTPDTYTVYMSLGGTYSVGAGGTFTTLNAAANAYNYACLTGPVTFVLNNSLYSATTETFPVVFRRNGDASATNSLLIIPAPATGVTIQGATTGSAGAVLKFLDARFITLNGSNAGGSLFVLNPNTNSVSTAIWLASGSNGGNSHVALRNLLVKGSSITLHHGISATDDNIVFSSQDGADNDHISIVSNTLQTLHHGIFAAGTTSTTYGGCDTWDVNGNLIGSAQSPSLGLDFSGIYMKGVSLFSIHNNTIANVTSTLSSQYGIWIDQRVNSGTISANTIRSIKYTGNATGYASGITLNPFNVSSNLLVANNMISDIQGMNTNVNSGVNGIRAGNSNYTGGIKFYNNTIALTQGTLLSSPSAVYSAAFYFGSFAARDFELVSNLIYSNIHNGGNTASRTYGVYSAVSNTIFIAMDYNNYYLPGPQGVMGFIASNNRTTTAMMQAGFGDNQNAVSLEPVFTSSVDAHVDPNAPSNWMIRDLGIPVIGITTDVDGQQRHPVTPDIGADEFTVTATCNGANGGTISPAAYTVCSSASLALTSASVSGGAGTVYQWQSATTPTGSFSSLTAGSGINTPYYNTAGQLAGGIYYIRLNTSCPSASLSGASNVVTVNVVASPTLSMAQTHTTVCAGNSATLSASGASTFSWSTGVTSPSIVITPTTSGLYYVYYGSFPCTYSTSENLSVFYSLNPTVTAGASHSLVCSGFPATLTASGANTYSWSQGPGSQSVVVTPTASSVYFVTGYLANGCSAGVTRSINVSASPTITVTGPSTLCSSQQVTLNASGGTTYTWSIGALTASAVVTPTANTAYSVTSSYSVSNSGGLPVPVCQASTTHSISLFGAQSLSVTSPASICVGQTATIIVDGATNYTWSTGQTTGTISPSPTVTTTYTVLGVSGTCSNTASVTVYVNPNPTITISGNATVCAGATTTLFASGGNSYLWSTGATQASVAVSPSVNTPYGVTGTSSLGCAASASVTVISNSLPVISIAKSATAICVGAPVTFTASGANAYTWTGFGNTATLTVTPAANSVYTVTGTSISGCVASKTVSVTHYSVPVITPNLSPSATVCAQTTVNLGATGVSSYSWMGIGQVIVFTLAPESYIAVPYTTSTLTVIGTDTHSCVGTATVLLVVNALPVISVSGGSAVCSGGSATLTAGGAASYSWSSGATSASIAVSPTTNTTYVVIGTNSAGCSASASVAVTLNQSPVISIVQSAATVCASSPVTLTATGANTYTWSGLGSSNSITVTPTVSTVYSVAGTSTAGCVSTKTVAVTTNSVPVITLTPGSATVCPQATFVPTASGASSYSFAGVGGLMVIMSGNDSPTVIPMPGGGTLYVSGAGANGCVGSTSMIVSTYSLPVISITGNNTICAGQTTTLTAGGALSYTWNTSATGPSVAVSPNSNTTYTVTGTNAAGCTSVATATVYAYAYPVISISPASATICSSGPLTLTASGATSYSWTGIGASNPVTVYPTSSAIYTVTGTNGGLCSSTGTVSVLTNSLPVITVSPPSVTVCAQTPVSFLAGGAGTFTWSSGGGNNAGATFTPAANVVYTVSGTDASNGCIGTKTVGVTTNSLPLIGISGSGAVCAGSSGTLTASGAVSYSWNTGATSAAIVVTPGVSTSYVVTGTNNAGCSASATMAVVVNTVPVIIVAQSAQTVCVNAPVTLTASGAASFSWTGFGNFSSIIHTPSGYTTYTVTGTSAAGCSSSATAAVATNSLPVITVSPASYSVCSLTPVSFTAGGAITYTWTGSGGNNATATFTPAAASVFTVYGTDAGNGCIGSATVSVMTNTLPALSISGSTAVCFGGSATLTAGGATSYSWAGGPSTASFAVTPAASTVYVVSGTNVAGCVSTASYAVTSNTLPVITVTSSANPVCVNSDVTFTAGGASTYTWTNYGSANPITLTATASAVYTVTGTSAQGCVSSATIGVSTTPSPVIVVTPPNVTVCAFTPVSFMAAGAQSYTWSNGANGQTSVYNLSASGIHSVSGTNALGCVGTRTFFITIKPAPAISVLASPPAICAGSSAILSASGAATYTWSNGSNSPTISVSPNASSGYLVTGSSTLGCIGSASLLLTVHPLPVVSVSPSSATICLGDSLQLVAGGAATYSWSPGNLTGSVIKVSPDTVTVYSVDAIDMNGCMGQAQVVVAVDLCTGVKETQPVDAGIYLYPNPSYGRITAEFRFAGEKEITIYNTAGQRILHLRSGEEMEPIDLAPYAKGLYMVNVRSGTRTADFRVIIQ